jgi:class 3 adenylate cyclase
MESHGVPGRVHVTEATYQALRTTFDFEPRGPIDIKGKGAMSTYVLVGPKPAPLTRSLSNPTIPPSNTSQ